MKKYSLFFIIILLLFLSSVKAEDLSEYFKVRNVKICKNVACTVEYDENNAVVAGDKFLVKIDWSLNSPNPIQYGDTVSIPFANDDNTEDSTSFNSSGFSWTDIYDDDNNLIGQWRVTTNSATGRNLSIKFSDNSVGKNDISGTFITPNNISTNFTYIDKIVPLTVGKKTYHLKVSSHLLTEITNDSLFYVSSSNNSQIVLAAISPRITLRQLYDINKYPTFTNDAKIKNTYFELSVPSDLNTNITRISFGVPIYLPISIEDYRASYSVSSIINATSFFTRVEQNDDEIYTDFKKRLNKYEYGIFSDGDDRMLVVNIGEQPSMDYTYSDVINRNYSNLFEPGDFSNYYNPFTVNTQVKDIINNLAGSSNRIGGKIPTWSINIYLEFPTVKIPTIKQINGVWSWQNENNDVKVNNKTVEATMIVPDSIAVVSGTSQLMLRDKDSKNEIAGAKIKLQKKNGNTFDDIEEVTTDSSGIAQFRNLESGTYRYVQTGYLSHYQNNSFLTYKDVELVNEVNVFEFDKNEGNIIYATNEKEKFTVTYKKGEHGDFEDQLYNNIPYGAVTPYFEATDNNGWIFTGWTPETNPYVVADATYTANWKKMIKVKSVYLDIDSNSEISSEEITVDKNGTEYSTFRKDIENYEYVKTDGEATGIRGDKDIVVKYYYKKKESKLTIKYLDCTTKKEVAPSTIEKLFYGESYDADEYEKSITVANNYNRSAYNKTENYKGIVKNDNINVEYCYVKKDSKVNSDIKIEGTNEITSSKDKVSYKIDYNAYFTDYIGNAEITLVDKLPYKIDINNSNIDGGLYDDKSQTITWVINASIDSYQNNNYSITKNIELSYLNINIKDDIMANGVSANLNIDNKNSISKTNYNTYININGTIKVKYIDVDNTEMFDEIITANKVGKTFELEEKEKEGYKIIKKPDKSLYEYIEGIQQFVYVYERIKLKVSTNVLTDGGEISGDEEVLYGENSKVDNIVVKAHDGYKINEVLINDKKIEIPDNQTELIIPYFTNMTEDKKIDVSFNKIGDIVSVPNTSKKNYLIIIGGILFVTTFIITLYIFIKRKLMVKL